MRAGIFLNAVFSRDSIGLQVPMPFEAFHRRTIGRSIGCSFSRSFMSTTSSGLRLFNRMEPDPVLGSTRRLAEPGFLQAPSRNAERRRLASATDPEWIDLSTARTAHDQGYSRWFNLNARVFKIFKLNARDSSSAKDCRPHLAPALEFELENST
jgi:hypothetical protein